MMEFCVPGPEVAEPAEFAPALPDVDESGRQTERIEQKLWIIGERATAAARRRLARCKEDPFSADAGLLS